MAHLLNNLDTNPGLAYLTLDEGVGTAGELGQTVDIDSETLLVVGGAGTTDVLCERGVQGTSVAAHAVGAAVALSGTQTVTMPGGVTLAGLPTVDPGIAGAVWSNGGVLTLSAGPS